MARTFEQWLRRASMAEICGRLDPFDPSCEGMLYAEQTASLPPELEAEARRFAARHGLDPEVCRRRMTGRQLMEAGKLRMVSGEPLASESVAPFVLDGRAYRSVLCFYESLKLPEDDPQRAAVAVGAGRRRRLGRPFGRASFRYGGEEIAVGSVAHGVLVARATEAKVNAHEHVQRGLAATGASRLYMGDAGSQVLGRYMPFALMIVRCRMAR